MRKDLVEEIAKEAMRLSDEDYEKFIEYLQKQIDEDKKKEKSEKHESDE